VLLGRDGAQANQNVKPLELALAMASAHVKRTD